MIRDAKSHACGLDNLGATCYMNATIQAIAHCPKLVETIVDVGDQKNEVLSSLRKLLIRMWEGTHGSIPPRRLLHSLAAPMAKQGITEMRDVHDANELYMVLSDVLCESTAALKTMLEGKTRGSTVCGRCGATSLTPLEPFVALNLDFKDASPHSLEEMIERLFATEEIEGYQCDACKSRSISKKNLQLFELPCVLTFVLKRFLPDGRVNRADVSLPGSITIRGSRTVTYRLCSVVCHSGHSQQGGHYVTAARVREEWSIHDDESTIQLTDAHASHIRRSAYMILYEREKNA